MSCNPRNRCFSYPSQQSVPQNYCPTTRVPKCIRQKPKRCTSYWVTELECCCPCPCVMCDPCACCPRRKRKKKKRKKEPIAPPESPVEVELPYSPINPNGTLEPQCPCPDDNNDCVCLEECRTETIVCCAPCTVPTGMTCGMSPLQSFEGQQPRFSADRPALRLSSAALLPDIVASSESRFSESARKDAASQVGMQENIEVVSEHVQTYYSSERLHGDPKFLPAFSPNDDDQNVSIGNTSFPMQATSDEDHFTGEPSYREGSVDNTAGKALQPKPVRTAMLSKVYTTSDVNIPNTMKQPSGNEGTRDPNIKSKYDPKSDNNSRPKNSGVLNKDETKGPQGYISGNEKPPSQKNGLPTDNTYSSGNKKNHETHEKEYQDKQKGHVGEKEKNGTEKTAGTEGSTTNHVISNNHKKVFESPDVQRNGVSNNKDNTILSPHPETTVQNQTAQTSRPATPVDDNEQYETKTIPGPSNLKVNPPVHQQVSRSNSASSVKNDDTTGADNDNHTFGANGAFGSGLDSGNVSPLTGTKSRSPPKASKLTSPMTQASPGDYSPRILSNHVNTATNFSDSGANYSRSHTSKRASPGGISPEQQRISVLQFNQNTKSLHSSEITSPQAASPTNREFTDGFSRMGAESPGRTPNQSLLYPPSLQFPSPRFGSPPATSQMEFGPPGSQPAFGASGSQLEFISSVPSQANHTSPMPGGPLHWSYWPEMKHLPNCPSRAQVPINPYNNPFQACQAPIQYYQGHVPCPQPYYNNCNQWNPRHQIFHQQQIYQVCPCPEVSTNFQQAYEMSPPTCSNPCCTFSAPRHDRKPKGCQMCMCPQKKEEALIVAAEDVTNGNLLTPATKCFNQGRRRKSPKVVFMDGEDWEVLQGCPSGCCKMLPNNVCLIKGSGSKSGSKNYFGISNHKNSSNKGKMMLLPVSLEDGCTCPLSNPSTLYLPKKAHRKNQCRKKIYWS